MLANATRKLSQIYDSSVSTAASYVGTQTSPGCQRAALKGIKALAVRVFGSRHAGNMTNSRRGPPNRACSGRRYH